MHRQLKLRREALAELSTGELASLAGGDTVKTYSCLDYVSCYHTQCTLICPE